MKEGSTRYFTRELEVNFKGYFAWKWFAYIPLLLSGIEDVFGKEQICWGKSFSLTR